MPDLASIALLFPALCLHRLREYYISIGYVRTIRAADNRHLGTECGCVHG